MGEAIGQTLSLGVAVSLSPVPVIVVVLMLSTPRARRNGPAFLGGWLAGLSGLGAVVLLVANSAGPSRDGEPATWVSWVKLALGVLLLLVAARTWRSRPKGAEQAELPGWMRALDTFTAARSFGTGALLCAANPKNLILTFAGATAIAQTGIPAGQQIVALVVFVVLGALGPALPLTIYFGMGARAGPVLGNLKDWMTHHNAAILTVLALIIGAKLAGDAITGLAG